MIVPCCQGRRSLVCLFWRRAGDIHQGTGSGGGCKAFWLREKGAGMGVAVLGERMPPTRMIAGVSSEGSSRRGALAPHISLHEPGWGGFGFFLAASSSHEEHATVNEQVCNEHPPRFGRALSLLCAVHGAPTPLRCGQATPGRGAEADMVVPTPH